MTETTPQKKKVPGKTGRPVGRPKGREGVKLQKQRRVVQGILSSGPTPLEFLIDTMRDETRDFSERFEAAKAAAPFVHARKAAVAVEHRHVSSVADIGNDKLLAVIEGSSKRVKSA